MAEFEAIENVRWQLRLTKSQIVRESLKLFADVTKRALKRISDPVWKGGTNGSY
jgi:hypothetical protein